MAADIVFFLASDDEIAAATRLKGPGPEHLSLACHGFDPDDAVVEWEMFFETGSCELTSRKVFHARTWPRCVAPMHNDGVGVFAVPDMVVGALAGAAPDRLRGLVARWVKRLIAEGDGGEVVDIDPVAVVDGVVRLAAVAERPGSGVRLYCWYY
ncbi:hypothetical protein ACWFMI_21045 [Nocardiopsis terrae]